MRSHFWLRSFRYLLIALSLPALSQARPPNIILIMADDLGWESIGCYGSQDYQTPHLDKLARDGVRFLHCYSTPLCTPSRVQIMTGKYNFRNYTHFGYLDPGEKTFGHLMKQAGYRTAIAGKWQLNGIYNGFPGNQDSERPLRAGFDESLLWQVTKGRGKGSGGGERYWEPPLERNGQCAGIEEHDDQYGPDLMANFVCDFMERHQNEPFFVYYPMVLVHDPFVTTPDTHRGPVSHEDNRQPEGQTARKENFGAMISYMDKIVGRIRAKTEELGLAEDTLILFTSDNGTHRSITSRWQDIDVPGGKGMLIDPGTHVPLIAYWKGRSESGKEADALVDFTDFYPTLAAAAGLQPGTDDPVDGLSFLHVITGEKGPTRSQAICHYQPYWGFGYTGQFVRTARYKLYRDGRFFDLQQDLFEEHVVDGRLTPAVERVRLELSSLIDRLPPVPSGSGNDPNRVRPVYPDWDDPTD